MIRDVIIVSMISLFAAACSVQPSLDIKPYQPKLVVDGSIEQNDYPRVTLTYSDSYFVDIDSASIRQLIATTAKVTVSDGTQEEVLTLRKGKDVFPPYYYVGNSLKGEVGKTYNLTIELRGETYTAHTTIPPLVNFDSLWYQLASDKDSLGFIYGRFTDDPNVANYYRVFTKRKNKDTKYYPVYLSAVGDQFFNGKSFTFSILRGPDDFSNVIDDLYFKIGDTVDVKLCTIDKAHFDFWRTVERELYVVGNPFSSSGNDIISNIDGHKALGVWGGYGATYTRIVTK